MEVKAVQKYVRVSPRKLRLVADAIREMSPQEALDILPFLKKRATEPLSKVIKTALANAKDVGLTEEKFKFKSIQINEGPRLKRGRPVSRGMWHPFQKKMSHIVVILEAKDVATKLKKKKTKRDVKGKVKTVKSSTAIKERLVKKPMMQIDRGEKRTSQKQAGGTVKDRKTVRTTNK